MIAWKAENRIPTVSLYAALYDIIHQFKHAAQINYQEANLINKIEYDAYLDWMNLAKLSY
jgi:hypothetical protein